jgi:hypothetical protein
MNLGQIPLSENQLIMKGAGIWPKFMQHYPAGGGIEGAASVSPCLERSGGGENTASCPMAPDWREHQDRWTIAADEALRPTLRRLRFVPHFVGSLTPDP